MLRANVGLSRKICREFQSTGYSVTLDGEIPFVPDDAEGVLEKVRELFDLAQEALDREIDRDQGEAAIGRRDVDPPAPVLSDAATARQETVKSQEGSHLQERAEASPTHGSTASNGQAATEKQIQFILTMGRRSKLSMIDLEARVAQAIGRRCGVYDLSKREAGQVIDALTADAKTASTRR
jgi:hypothetical protein